MPTSRSGRHHEPFTVDDLANALRGIPRDAQFFVRLPGGEERPVVAITGMGVRRGMNVGPEAWEPYAIVLLTGDGGDAAPSAG